MRKAPGEEGTQGERQTSGAPRGCRSSASTPCPLRPTGDEAGRWAPEPLCPGAACAWPHPHALRGAGVAAWPGVARPGGPRGPLPALVQTRHGVDFRIPPPPPPPPGRGTLSIGLRPETQPPACVFRAAPPPLTCRLLSLWPRPLLPRPCPTPIQPADPVAKVEGADRVP